MATIGDSLFALSTIPYPSLGSAICSALHFAIAIVGTIALGVVVWCTVGNESNPGSWLILSLCLADLGYCIESVVFGYLGAQAGGWSTGEIGCVISDVVVTGSCVASMLSLTALTLERYQVVAAERVLTQATTTRWLVCIWSTTLVIALMPLYTWSFRDSVAINGGMFLCTVAWWSRHPWTLVRTSLCLVVVVSSCSFICYAYYFIIARLAVAVPNQSQITTTTKTTFIEMAQEILQIKSDLDDGSIKPKAERMTRQERVLLRKALTITMCFIVCWSPYTFLAFYELISGQIISREFDSIACVLAVGPIATHR
ncbi:hypothetical protein HDU91_002738 [Kappamyces sp. JEL0680]|nr:hypothetical protein HDU91_002738 [Kappamyces sp. JEL0680]